MNKAKEKIGITNKEEIVNEEGQKIVENTNIKENPEQEKNKNVKDDFREYIKVVAEKGHKQAAKEKFERMKETRMQNTENDEMEK